MARKSQANIYKTESWLKGKRYDLGTFSKNLYELRVNRQIRKRTVENDTGLNQRTITDAESAAKDSKTTDFKNVLVLCNYYDVDIDHLFGIIKESTHDMAFICKKTGLSEEVIQEIQGMTADRRKLLEVLITETSLLDWIYDYVMTDTKRDGIMYQKDLKTIGFAKVIQNEFIPLPDNASDESIKLFDDMRKRALLDEIRDILNSVKQDVF